MPEEFPRTGFGEPPDDLDLLIDWFDGFARGLVLLEEHDLEEIRRAIGSVRDAVIAHCARGTVPGLASPSFPPERERLIRLLEAEHERFRTSVEQLAWFYSVVEREDHGGHRQALGQYGRVLAESLRRHRADELALELPRDTPGALRPSSPGSAKGY